MSEPIARLADCLVEAGVDLAFGVSGSGPSYQLITALRSRGVRYVAVSHEAVGPVAAGAYGALTGKRAAAIAIKGPGFANMVAGMSAAYLEGYAPVCIAENYDDSVPVERMHKRIDQHAIATSVVEGLYSLSDLDDLPAALGRPHPTRPVYIELSKTACARPRHARGDTAASALQTPGAFADQIAAARTPLVIAGSVANRSDWKTLIAALQVPVLTTAKAKGVIDERLPNAAGVYTGVGKTLAPETGLLPLADVVVTIGLRNMEILGVDGKPKFVNLDIAHPLSTTHDVTLDDSGVEQVLKDLASKPEWGRDVIAAQRARWQEYVASYRWMPGQVFCAVDALDEPHVLVLDTGTFCTVGEHAWRAHHGRDFLGSSNGRNLGIGVPHALGAACARPGTPIFCVVGDGGVRYYVSEIRAIAERNMPVCVILMKDGRYGSIACNVPVQPADPAIVEPAGTSWLAVMRAMGLAGGRADNAIAFKDLLGSWNRQTPYFIEAEFDPGVYLQVADAIRG